MSREINDSYLVRLCRDLIGIKSYSCDEREIAYFIRDTMRDLGYKARIDEWGNVIGEIDEGDGRNIVFEGHMDTVAADEKEWKHGPFEGIVEGGRMYGRGTSDMKGALSAMIYGASMAEISGKLTVVCVPMEEIFEGILFGKALDSMKPDLVVLGEATDLNLNIGQRGRAEIVVETKGVPAHSSNPEKGVNAVYEMMPVIEKIRELKLPEDQFLGNAVIELTDIISTPYPGASVIPYRCRATFDRRLVLGENEQGVIEHMRSFINEGNTTITTAEGSSKTYTGKEIVARKFFPAWRVSEENDLVKKSFDALKDINADLKLSRYSFCTDGSESAGRRGITTIGFGPSKESIAHTNDEYIEIRDLVRSCEGYIAIAEALLS